MEEKYRYAQRYANAELAAQRYANAEMTHDNVMRWKTD